MILITRVQESRGLDGQMIMPFELNPAHAGVKNFASSVLVKFNLLRIM